MAATDRGEDSPDWPVPEIIPLPSYTEGVLNPCMSLDGKWNISAEPQRVENSVNGQSEQFWSQVTVPGQADKQGIKIQRDSLFSYQTKFDIPANFVGKRVFVRFESVSGIATPYLDGNLLEPHAGGFTIWSREITHLVSSGGAHELKLDIIDPPSEKWSSGFDYGGICRSVQLIALPSSYLKSCHIHADLDDHFVDARLRIETVLQRGSADRCKIEVQIEDAAGRPVKTGLGLVEINYGDGTVVHIDVPSAQKWDAEHPNLYTLKVLLFINDRHAETVHKKFGIRKIVVSGNRLLVNGMEVKLRGGGRFDSNPTLGHTLSSEQCHSEVRLLKEANLNYIRPACYPASEAYLSACDELGMYVEGETSVTFIRGTESDPKLTSLFMNQMASMIEANVDHPCILHWSLGNESNYGINIAKTFEYTRRADPSRPILFSWSHGIPASAPLPYNIFSYHYPDCDGDLSNPGVAIFNGGVLDRQIPQMPILHDEFAHGPCFDRAELKRDPNVHNFWGESIKIFWEKMHETPGCLGGAIWAVIDEPASKTRVFEWGMLDLWRRKKPEYWLMKKAYSPVRLSENGIGRPHQGEPLNLEVANWHDHTNLDELELKWSIAKEQGTFRCPSVPPGAKGTITIPGREWKSNETLALEFSFGGRIVDEYQIKFPSERIPESVSAVINPIEIHDDRNSIAMIAGKTRLDVDQATGMIRVQSDHQTVIESGPNLHLIGRELPMWKLTSITTMRMETAAQLTINGSYGDSAVTFAIHLGPNGDLRIIYKLESFNLTAPQKRLVPWNSTCAGGFSEVGISFELPSNVDRLRWRRAGLYSVYPDDHIGRTAGTAMRTATGCKTRAGERPGCSWSQDEQNFNLFGTDDPGRRGTNDFRSMKEYIYFAAAEASENGKSVVVRSDGKSHAVRLEVLNETHSGRVKLIINDGWNYTNLGLGNFMKSPIDIGAGHSSEVLLQFGPNAG